MIQYASKNASFRLPFQFDPTQLEQDLERCRSFDFLTNYVPDNYAGAEYLLPLRSIDGRMDFPVAVPDSIERYQNTAALNACTYFQQVIDSFLCPKEAIRLMRLPAGAKVNPHTDHNCGYEDGVFRVHIPILTNDQVSFVLDKKQITMKPGEAWYTNVNLEHSVVNNGQTERIHLVIDGVRNAWSDELFKAVGYDFEMEGEVSDGLSDETIHQVIEQLRLLEEPGAEIAIADLRARLNKS